MKANDYVTPTKDLSFEQEPEPSPIHEEPEQEKPASIADIFPRKSDLKSDALDVAIKLRGKITTLSSNRAKLPTAEALTLYEALGGNQIDALEMNNATLNAYTKQRLKEVGFLNSPQKQSRAERKKKNMDT